MPSTIDRKAIREAEKRSAREDRDRGEFLVAAMSTIPGRKYLWDQLETAHIFASSFSENPLRMAFVEGERNNGLQLLNDLIQWCPDLFIQAMREANGRRTERASTDADTAPGSDRSAPDEHLGGEEPGRDAEGSAGPTVDADGQVHYGGEAA